MALIQTRLGRNEGGILWGVLQAIAIAIVVTLLTLKLPPLPRAAVGLALLAAYQFVILRNWLPQVLAAPHGGLPGALRLGQPVDPRHRLRRPLLPLTPS